MPYPPPGAGPGLLADAREPGLPSADGAVRANRTRVGERDGGPLRPPTVL